jgi:uncharacterized protein (DUF362 family)/NAD-dependent dihydropyrimidine dehydrogenase PreA subunit
MNSKVSIVRCKSYDPSLVQEATRRAIDLIGGISSFIKPASTVLIKPNLLMAKEPKFGVDTHPEVVRAVIKILKGINCSLYLGDGPSVWGNQEKQVDEVYERSGVKRVCEEEGVELVKFEKRRWRNEFPLTTWLDVCDYFVSIPKFKTHDLTILTGAVKNLFGLVVGTYKAELHKKYFAVEDFAKILVDIYEEAKPHLIIIDGIVAMEDDGPATAGKLRNTGLILAGSDGVALDSILALIMGLEPLDILTTKEAAKRGLGVTDINLMDILGDRLEDVIEEPFRLPATSMIRKIPRPIIEIAKNLIRFYPAVKHNNCTRCGICIAACPNKAISMNSNRIVIDYSKCISCFCCQESCPASAIKVKKSILAKIVGL